MKMTTAQYIALVDRVGYAPAQAAHLKGRLEAGDAGARFAVYGAALRKGLVHKEGKPLSEGTIVTCPVCGASWNDARPQYACVHGRGDA
jgi:hypothetical protein